MGMSRGDAPLPALLPSTAAGQQCLAPLRSQHNTATFHSKLCLVPGAERWGTLAHLG